MKKVLFIVGSLRQGSFSADTAKKVEALLAGKAEVSYLDYRQVPVFSQDLETPVLPVVQSVRDEIAKADAVWIFSPVYNQAIPGPIKNLLDWLSRALDLSDTTGPSAINGKEFTVTVTSAAFQQDAIADYKKLLPFIRTNVIGEFTAVQINPEAWGTGELTLSEETKTQLQAQVEAVLNA